MKIAVIGPICKDINTIGRKQHTQPGGVTYYTGQALASLGVETTVFGSFQQQDPPRTEGFRFDLVHIEARGTMVFKNTYPDPHNLNKRIQEADTPHNRIRLNDIPPEGLSVSYLVLGPLYHDNISASTIKEFARNVEGTYTQLVLSVQ